MKKTKAFQVRLEQEDGRIIGCPKTGAITEKNSLKTAVVAKRKRERSSQSSPQWFKQIYPKPRNFPIFS